MKKILFGLFMIAGITGVQAQSYHFSQFFSTPLLTNPANTGFTNGPFRIASNFRSQGMPGSNNYFTGYLSADVSPLRGQLAEGHKAGLGVYVMNDQSLSSAVQTSSVGLSAAYHVGLDIYGERSFGLGIQGTYNQRRIDYSKLRFENQYGPGGFDDALPVGEAFDANNKSFFDLNAGAIFNSNVGNKAFFAGVAVYNILRHREDFTGDEFKMPTRYTLQAGAAFSNGAAGTAYFSLTAMGQSGSTTASFGGAYGFNLTEEEKNELMGGLWYRWNDAVIPYIGYQHTNFQVGLSYDYTVSSLKTGAEIRNGIELTLLYKAFDKRELKMNIPWY